MWGSYVFDQNCQRVEFGEPQCVHCSLFFVDSKSCVFTGWHRVALASTTVCEGWTRDAKTLENEDLEPIQIWWVHPGRITWNTIMEVWKIIFLSKWVICRFHVNLPGCIGIGSEDFPCKTIKGPVLSMLLCFGGYNDVTSYRIYVLYVPSTFPTWTSKKE